MKYRIMVQIALVFLLGPLAAFAGNDQQISCPAIDVIKMKSYYLNTINKSYDTYTVYSTPGFYFNKFTWNIITKVQATDFNTAYDLGVENIKNIVSLKEPIAKKQDTFTYLCQYIGGNTGTVSVAAILFLDDEKSSKKNNVKISTLLG